MEARIDTSQPDPLRQRQARSYQRARRRLGRYAQAWSLALVVLGALAGARLASALTGGHLLVVDAALYLLGAGALLELLTLPFAVQGWRMSRAVGLSQQSFAGWLIDLAKGLAVGFVLGLPVLSALLWAQERWPHGWWVAASAASLALTVLLAAVAPLVLVPLFYRSRPLDAGALRDDLLALATSARVRIGSIRVLQASHKTSAANAFVIGLGPTRRIMLFDTLLGGDDELDPERIAEARAVLAHELGHQRSNDLWRGMALDAVITTAVLALSAVILLHLPHALVHGGVGSFSALPALALVYGLVHLPFGLATSAYSRRRERAADAFGLRLAGEGEAFARALERLCSVNLSELQPPRLTALRGSHPSPAERIAVARAFAGRESHNGHEPGVGEPTPAIPRDHPAPA